MAYGLLQDGNRLKAEAMAGLRDAEEKKERREMQNENLKDAKRQGEVQSTASMAVTGAVMGNNIVPGWGAVVGGVIGGLAGWASS